MALDKLLHLPVGALLAAYVLPEGWIIAIETNSSRYSLAFRS